MTDTPILSAGETYGCGCEVIREPETEIVTAITYCRGHEYLSGMREHLGLAAVELDSAAYQSLDIDGTEYFLGQEIKSAASEPAHWQQETDETKPALLCGSCGRSAFTIFRRRLESQEYLCAQCANCGHTARISGIYVI